MALPKQFRGDKYIYLLMALKLINHTYDIAKEKFTSGHIKIGADNGYIGGQNYERRFILHKWNEQWILQEIKASRAFADFSKYYEVLRPLSDIPVIREYINQDGDNCSKNWVH